MTAKISCKINLVITIINEQTKKPETIMSKVTVQVANTREAVGGGGGGVNRVL